eukprot:1210547-Amphidinium_carterae.1
MPRGSFFPDPMVRGSGEEAARVLSWFRPTTFSSLRHPGRSWMSWTLLTLQGKVMVFHSSEHLLQQDYVGGNARGPRSTAEAAVEDGPFLGAWSSLWSVMSLLLEASSLPEGLGPEEVFEAFCRSGSLQSGYLAEIFDTLRDLSQRTTLSRHYGIARPRDCDADADHHSLGVRGIL